MAMPARVKMDQRGVRGIGAGDMARAKGHFIGAPVTKDMNDDQVLDAPLSIMNEMVESAGVPIQYADVVAASSADDGNITLSGEQLVGGVDLVEGDRTLLIAQTAGAQNGLWIVHAGAWTRPTDFDGAGEAVTGAVVQVIDGSQAGLWRLTTEGTITIGTTAQTWRAFSLRAAVKVPYMPAGDGAVSTDVQAALRGLPVPVTQFGAVGDYDRDTNTGTDNTQAFRKAIAFALLTGARLTVPMGDFKVTDTLEIENELILSGAGASLSHITMVSASVKPIIRISCPDNESIIGLIIEGIRFVCNGNGSTAVCDGIEILGTDTNSSFRMCWIRDNQILNPRIGIKVDAVFYRNMVLGNTITSFFDGEVTEYGIYINSARDVTYNIFMGNEVTAVGNGAWAYWIHSNYSQFINNTADGYCYFSSPGGAINTLSVETIYAEFPPVTPYGACVVVLDQVQVASNINIIGCVNSRATTGVKVIGTNTTINSTRFTAPQPNNSYLFDAGSSGVVNGTFMTGAVSKLEDSNSPTVLNRWIFNACNDITIRGGYEEGTWTPSFSVSGEEWSTAPSVSSATYVKDGRVITLFLNFNGGVCPDYASIGGLPYTSGQVGTATMSSGNVAKRFIASIPTGVTKINNIPAQNLTGVFCQLVATYRI